MEKRDENYQKKAKTKEENQKEEEEEKHIGNWQRKNLEREGKMTKSM